MKSKVEIINETVDFYSNNPRSKDPQTRSCMYLSEDGNKCAFSRCCTEEGVNQLHKYNEGEGAQSLNVDEFLQEEYTGHEKHFRSDIQSLHDNDRNWTEVGLSNFGKDFVQELLEKYKD